MHSARALAIAIRVGGVVASNSLIYGIPPFDATPTTSVLIISPSTTATAMTAVTATVTAAVDDTTTINSLQAADTTTLDELLHGGCKWISGVAVDKDLFLRRHSMQLAIHPHRRCSRNEFHHRDGLDVSMPLFSMVTFIHTGAVTRFAHTHTGNTSSSTDALSSLLILMPCATTSPSCTTTGTLCWCARAGGLANSAWAVRGKRKSSTSTHTQSWRWRPSLGSSSWLRVPSPSLSSITTRCPTRACWTGRRSASAFPEHRLLELPRILRSIPVEVVEMMQRRVVFVFEEFFKSLSTQVHTGEGSARINLFSGDNASQMYVCVCVCHPSPSTSHHCCGGMNRRALPCDDHPATLVRLRKQQHQLTPQHKASKQAMSNVIAARLSLSFSPSLAAITTTTTAATNTPSTADAAAAAPPPPLAAEHISQPTNQPTKPSPAAAAGGSWLFAAGNRWRQHKLHFPQAAAAAGEGEKKREKERRWDCRGYLPRVPAALASHTLPLLCSCSVPMCLSEGERLCEDRWRMMMGGAHMMEWEEQLWARTSMVMVGTSNHSDAVIFAVTATTTIAIDRTAAITLRSTPAPIWREADIAHVTRSDEEMSIVGEAHEAVEPTTMTMTSAEAAATEAADVWLQLDERALCILSISSSSSPSLVTNSSGCDHGVELLRRDRDSGQH
ncbi:hypothetical protein PTSG_13175, partial [Salpingoeca rosetta]